MAGNIYKVEELPNYPILTSRAYSCHYQDLFNSLETCLYLALIVILLTLSDIFNISWIFFDGSWQQVLSRIMCPLLSSQSFRNNFYSLRMLLAIGQMSNYQLSFQGQIYHQYELLSLTSFIILPSNFQFLVRFADQYFTLRTHMNHLLASRQR